MPEENYSQNEYNRGKDSFSNFANTATKPIQDKAKDKAKEFAAKAVKKAKDEAIKKLAAKKATSTVARWILSSLTTAGITTVLPVLIIIIILTILPYSIFSLLAINKNYDANNDKVFRSVNYVYNQNVNTFAVRTGIKKVLDREYNCQGTVNAVIPQYTEVEGEKVIDQFYYETETCRITVKLTPSALEMIPKVSAYVHAVNGVLDYYSKPEELDNHTIVNEAAPKDAPIYEKYSYDTSDLPSTDSSDNWYKINGTDKETGLPNYEPSDEVQNIMEDVYSNSADKKQEDYQTKQLREKLTQTMQVNQSLLFEDDTNLPIEEYFYTEQGHDINVHKATCTKEEKYCELNGTEVPMSVCNSGATTTTRTVDTCRYVGGSIQCTYKDVVSSGNVKTRKIVVHGYAGDVTLKVDYDVSPYRKNDLEALFTPNTETTIVGKGRCIVNVDSQGRVEGSEECTEKEATRVVHNLLFSYYKNSMALYTSNQNISSFNDIINFNFNRPITDTGKTGTLEYPTRSLDYVSFTGDYTKNSSVGRYIWNHAFDLKNAGLIGGSSDDYQCTFFAQTWFYDVYGWNSSGPKLQGSGNGNEFTQVVYDAWTYEDDNGEEKHYFEFADAPSAGGLISIDYYLSSGDAGTYGHIVCCDEVNYEEGYIVVSEGNTNGDGAISIRHKYTIDEFYVKHNGFMTFLNPTGKALEESGAKVKDIKDV